MAAIDNMQGEMKMIELLDKRCRLRHLGDGEYVCKRTIHCTKINDNGVFNVGCFKVIR